MCMNVFSTCVSLNLSSIFSTHRDQKRGLESQELELHKVESCDVGLEHRILSPGIVSALNY